jgi:Txe/YoeB family toxin of Txe-Axe toxin-antitoxin module
MRITKKHRLVFSINKNIIVVWRCAEHYDD